MNVAHISKCTKVKNQEDFFQPAKKHLCSSTLKNNKTICLSQLYTLVHHHSRLYPT